MISDIMDVEQIHEYFGCHIGRDRILKLLISGKIQSAKIGNKYLSRKKSLDEFLDSLFEDGFEVKEFDVIPVDKVVNDVMNKFNPDPDLKEKKKENKKSKKTQRNSAVNKK